MADDDGQKEENPSKKQPSPDSSTSSPNKDMADKVGAQRLGSLVCAIFLSFLLLLGLIALVVWLAYRPHRPRFTVQSVAIYSLNATAQATLITTSMQFTVTARNPSKRSDAEFRELCAFVTFRNQIITVPTPLPDLNMARRSSVVMAPMLGGGLVPISPDAAAVLAQAQAYGIASMRWVLQGKVRWGSGVFKSRADDIYVKCDVMVGLNPGFAGQVPLLGSPDCSVDL